MGTTKQLTDPALDSSRSGDALGNAEVEIKQARERFEIIQAYTILLINVVTMVLCSVLLVYVLFFDDLFERWKMIGLIVFFVVCLFGIVGARSWVKASAK